MSFGEMTFYLSILAANKKVGNSNLYHLFYDAGLTNDMNELHKNSFFVIQFKSLIYTLHNGQESVLSRKNILFIFLKYPNCVNSQRNISVYKKSTILHRK